jgi:hypothetical protein
LWVRKEQADLDEDGKKAEKSMTRGGRNGVQGKWNMRVN